MNYRLTLCYDGSRYDGWQKQENSSRTIQGKLEAVLSEILSEKIEVAGSGRTDAGVHARQQVCSFHAETAMGTDEILLQLRRYLPEDIGAMSLSVAPPRFHARLSCKGKTYVYRIWNSTEPNVFERKYMCCFPDALDTAAMKKAAALLCGEHDFSSFCANKHMKKSTVRRIDCIDIDRTGNELRLRFTGNGFLYNMVRILVGTLLEVGCGKRSPESMEELLVAKDRASAGFTAPAHGLTLWDVYY